MPEFALVNASPTPLDAGIVEGLQRATIVPTAVATYGQVFAASAAIDLVLGNQHLTFPNWRTSGGPMAFPLVGHLDGSALTGMGPDVVLAPALEYTVLIGAVVALVNVVAEAITTVKGSGAAPAGQRFADNYTIPALSASMFIAMDVGGETRWFQIGS